MAKKKTTSATEQPAIPVKSEVKFTLAEQVELTVTGAEIVRGDETSVVFVLNNKKFKVERLDGRTKVIQLFADSSKRLIYTEVMNKYEFEESLKHALANITAAAK